MPARPEQPRVQKRIPSVPLFLIPKVIQEQIKKKGTSVFSIFVERRLHHQYRVRVETFFEHSRRVREGKAEKPEPTVQDVLDV
ncbi:hypothetical protein [Methanoregula sp.]|uniref:hypothetical protein n=1 Tax=Methanoregula sp. TaxID=2052170 RepID=UPI002CAFD7D0|nr:hypothetical protein [Methanoregula sp.]HVP96744.1 hypothetical protein [Methanoregula sp.]